MFTNKLFFLLYIFFRVIYCGILECKSAGSFRYLVCII